MSTDEFLAHLQELQKLTDDVRVARVRLEPIYMYYFPDEFLHTVGRVAGVKKHLDFSLFSDELNRLRQTARSCIDDAGEILDRIGALTVDPNLKRGAQLGYNQVYFDGHVIVLIDLFVRSMADDDLEEAALAYGGLKEFSEKANENLAELGAFCQGLDA